MEAKRKEIESWIEHGVFEEVEWAGQPMRSLRLIVTENIQKESNIIKVRRVAWGLKEEYDDSVMAESSMWHI